MISILNLEESKPLILYFDIKIFSKPNLSASAILWSILVTGLSSPLSPVSAAKQYWELMERSSEDEIMLTRTARSIAGSSTFIPPAIFRKTSLLISLKPPLFLKLLKALTIV